MANLNTYVQKHELCAENILYIYRKDRKTVIKRTDSEEFAMFIPISSILTVLPECEFLNISKVTIHCYQPEPGYCACVLQVLDS